MTPQHRSETSLPRGAARALSAVIVLVALGVAAWSWFSAQGSLVPLDGVAAGAGAPAGTPTPAAAPTPTAAGTVIVHVTGAVGAAGVYELPLGARVDDAIRVAGGLVGEADEAALNRAQVLVDAQQVYVPVVGEALPAAGAPGGGAAGGGAPGLINVNTASAAQLEELPGVGPALAGRIIEWRESRGRFSSVEDLLDVPGIGPAILEKVRSQVTV